METATEKNLNFVYFGGEPIGLPVLKELMACGYNPSLIVCNPDRKAGRGQKLTPPPIKVFAEECNIPVFQPESVKDAATIPEISEQDWDLFVVVAYNKIMPEWLIELPKHKTVNVHPSILPLRRGANPIRSAIVEDDRDAIGVSIMLMDKEMDHGPILNQLAVPIADEHWPISGIKLDETLANTGGALLADTITRFVAGDIEPQEQAHDLATYTGKIQKTDAELTLDPKNLPDGEEAFAMLCKIRGYEGFPGAYFFHNDTRVKINEAELTVVGKLDLIYVTPAGKKTVAFNTWLQSV